MYPDEKHSVNMTTFAFQKDIYFYDFYFTPKKFCTQHRQMGSVLVRVSMAVKGPYGHGNS